MRRRSTRDGKPAPASRPGTAASFRARLLGLLEAIAATDEARLVAGVVDYVRTNAQVAATCDHPPPPEIGPPRASGGPVSADEG